MCNGDYAEHREVVGMTCLLVVSADSHVTMPAVRGRIPGIGCVML
jgi:hypothetical protein